ncbi:MAG: hypothetical protein HOP07_07835 [Bacteriovoracaceae bacterium]|nr:hypothetical protein [Bacteriovoracaceae bacterium]
MSQIIILLENKEFSENLRQKISEKYGVEVLESQSSTEAKSFFDFIPNIEILLCSEIIAKDRVAFEMCEYLSALLEEDKAGSKPVHVVVLGKKSPYYPYLTLMGDKPDTDKIISYIGYLLGKETENVMDVEDTKEIVPEENTPKIKTAHVATEWITEEDPETLEAEKDKTTVFKLTDIQKKAASEANVLAMLSNNEYTSFSASYFSHLSDLTFDFSIYARVKKAEGFEYNCKIQANVKVSATDLERILLRCGKELYVTAIESSQASSFLNRHFVERFKKENLSLVERMRINSESFEVLLNIFKHSSFDKYNIEIVKNLISSISSANKLVENVSSLKQLLAGEKLSYGYNHLFLTNYLIGQTIDKFPWSKDQSKNKILYLAIFHDLALHNDRLIKLHHHYLAEKSKLTAEENQLILNHAHDAAVILETIVKAPLELTSIVKEHHGMKTGKGLPESLSYSLPPLMMAHIVVEDFVTQYLDVLLLPAGSEFDEKIKDILTELKKKYQKLVYLEVLIEIENLFKKPAGQAAG